MNDKDLIALAVQMREQQRLFFKTKYTSYLREAKALERRFDMEVQRREKAKNDKLSPGLFG